MEGRMKCFGKPIRKSTIMIRKSVLEIHVLLISFKGAIKHLLTRKVILWESEIITLIMKDGGYSLSTSFIFANH